MASTICMVGNGCSVLPSLWHLLCWKWKCGYDCIWMRRLEGDVPDPQRFIEIETLNMTNCPHWLYTLYTYQHFGMFWSHLVYFFKDCKCAELRMVPRKLRVLALTGGWLGLAADFGGWVVSSWVAGWTSEVQVVQKKYLWTFADSVHEILLLSESSLNRSSNRCLLVLNIDITRLRAA